MNQRLLEVVNVSKAFKIRQRRRSGIEMHRAVDGVSFSVGNGQSVGLAGESGSGKSTLARMILLLERPTVGRIMFADQDITALKGDSLMTYRGQVQAVFQDSSGALSPRMRIRDIVAEPLVIQQPDVSAEQTRSRVADLLQRVGLPVDLLQRYPHELSGGQKQRIAIARSLIVEPQMLVLDEPVSALDVSVRSQVLNLLLDLQEERELSYLMISHDLSVLRHVTSHIVVMYLGQVAEQGPTEEVLFNPKHPYTQALVSASPQLEPGRHRTRVPVGVETESTVRLTGCSFSPRCPHAVRRCHIEQPGLLAVAQAGTHRAACHLLEAEGTGYWPDAESDINESKN